MASLKEVSRLPYIEKVRPFYDSDLIKIITGIRRCGKSVVLEQIMSEIKEKSENVIFLNFEDKLTTGNIKNSDALIKYVGENRKEGLCYIFLDEIQTLDGWQDACKTLRLHGNSLFITGSNSKLLSGEFTKELSGRYVAFRIRPFVYKEILEYAKILGKEVSISDYLVWGGFPKRFEFPDKKSQLQYLSDLDDTIVINDLVRRYKIKKEALFKNLVNYVLKSNARIFSAKSIYDYLKNEKMNCSVNTVMKFLSYLEEAYVIESVKQFSTKTKRELHFYNKIYNGDVAFNSLRCADGRYDVTHNFENIVYQELFYMGYELCVYDNNGKEIDFMATKNGKKYFVQAAYSVAEEKTYEREFAAFKTMDNLSKKILITNDDIDFSTSTVQHIKFKDFLMMTDLEG